MKNQFIILMFLMHLSAFSQNKNQIVVFPDFYLEQAIRSYLDKPTNNFNVSDLECLTRLSLVNRGITDLTGLEYAKNLTQLRLDNNRINDLTPLSNLKKLTNLSLNGNKIIDVKPIQNLKKLESLSIDRNQITDISSLKNLKKLKNYYCKF